MKHIGEAIRYYRGRLGLTQEELARRAGLSPGTVVLLENGQIQRPRVGTVHQIEEALGVRGKLQPFIARPLSERPAPLGVRGVGPFTAVFQRDGDWWIGYVEELPGANAQEKTLEEARESLKEAVADILEANRELTRMEFEGREVVREPLEVPLGT